MSTYVGLTATGELVLDGLTARGLFVSDGLDERGIFLEEYLGAGDAPVVSSISPTSGLIDTTILVIINGVYLTGASAVSFGADITVNSYVVDTDLKITANITIALAAGLGTRDVTVTTPYGSSTLVAAFTVKTAPPPYLPSMVSIDDVAYTILKDSLSVETRIEERSTASFIVIDKLGAYTFEEGYPVAFYDPTGVKVFGGVVDSVEVYRLSPSGGCFHAISCADEHYRADKRRAAESYVSKTAGYIVQDLWAKYLQAEGVTVGEIQTGPTVAEMVINYARVSEALDALAEKAGFIWQIDQNKELHFIDRSTNAAPWNFTALKSISTPTLKTGNPQYRNRQYVVGTAITDTQTNTFIGDGDIVKTFTVGYPIAEVPTITIDAVAASVGIKGLDTPGTKDFYWSKGDAIVTSDIAPGAGAVVVISYKGQYPVMVLSTDNAAIINKQTVERSGTGYVDDICDDPGTTSVDAAWELAAAKLQKYCRDSRRFSYRTNDNGLFPGQLQHVTYSLLGLDQDMLIEAVSMSEDGVGYIAYDVTCIEGPEMGSWSQLFKRLADQAKMIMDRINVGLGDTVIIMSSVQEDFGWAEATTQTVYACSVPAADLYPADSGLYPC